MQELLVRFEPPDIYGVPPSQEALKLKIPTQKLRSEPAATASNILPLSPLDQQPDLMESTTPITTEFNSLTISKDVCMYSSTF